MLTLTRMEFIRNIVKSLGKALEQAIKYISHEEIITFYNIIEKLNSFTLKSFNPSVNKFGAELLDAIQAEDKNVTLSNAIISFYDYFIGTDKHDLYNKVIYDGNEEALNILISRDVFNITKLFDSIKVSGHSKLAVKLWNSNYNLGQYQEGFFDDILCISSTNNNYKMLEEALGNGADVYKPCFGQQILIHAVKNNNYNNSVILINHGAVIPEDIIEYCYYDSCAESGVMGILFKFGASANHFNKYNSSMLLSALPNHTKSAKLLIDFGADVNYFFNNKTPLSEAINFGRDPFIIKYLIVHNASVSTISYGATILEDMIGARYIVDDEKVKIIPMILCRSNYLAAEIEEYKKYTENKNIHNILDSYIDNNTKICDDNFFSHNNNPTFDCLVNVTGDNNIQNY